MQLVFLIMNIQNIPSKVYSYQHKSFITLTTYVYINKCFSLFCGTIIYPSMTQCNHILGLYTSVCRPLMAHSNTLHTSIVPWMGISKASTMLYIPYWGYCALWKLIYHCRCGHVNDWYVLLQHLCYHKLFKQLLHFSVAVINLHKYHYKSF